MAVPTSGPRAPEPGGVIPAAWPAQAADTIVDTISKVRDKTTKPAIVAARALVYGLLAAIAGTIFVILFLVLAFRVLEYIPGNIWTVYAFFGVVFTLGGLLLLRKANTPVRAGD